MRYQRLQVNQAFRNERDCLWIGVVVSVLKTEVNLVRGKVHEGYVLEVFSNPDHEYLAAEATRLRIGVSKVL